MVRYRGLGWKSTMAWLGVLLVGVVPACVADIMAGGDPGGGLFEAHCATCHATPSGRVPTVEALRAKPPQLIMSALRFGVMRAQGQGLSVYEMQLIVRYLTGVLPGELAAQGPEANACVQSARDPKAARPGAWNGWGVDDGNSRFQVQPGLAAADLPRLKVKWAFGYHGSYSYGQPTVVGGTVYATSSTGRVYALDSRSGCTRWTFDAETASRTAISVVPAGGKMLAVFGDDRGNAYALDAAKGTLVWKVLVDSHPLARITGAPKVHGDRVYVPVSSLEEVASIDPSYTCCTFGGSVVSLDLTSGKVVWRTKFVPPARPVVGGDGRTHYAPAGVSVWNSPAIDAKRSVLYVGTGNSYTSDSQATSDAVIALDLHTGAIRWTRQVTPADNFVVGCPPPPCRDGTPCPPAPNCPSEPGPDVDFGAAVIIRHAGTGHDVLLASQKSGVVYALDPDRQGAVQWQTRVGEGSPLGGIEWGSSADERRLYAPVSDVLNPPDHARPGLAAIDWRTGVVDWHVPAPTGACSWKAGPCLVAFQQATTVIPGAVLVGGMDGHLRAYATSDGALLWDLDTAVPYATVNAVPAEGGSLDLGGAVVVDGTIYVNSGYGRLVGRPGNVLLALSVDGH